ncbi:hypothetical protein UFOVP1605_41 [uncultured Caudovirales phage]|uniref:Uncharacterized protein n=1 Tax=uncultured Caudovirales phage TaxID=2100421 RepID=A0A6J5STN2_9CAUD|nr:hypothetical protein UFOVP1605_41 [uncultured Caudovirales phage]
MKLKPISISCDLEQSLADSLTEVGISFIHESQRKQRLDFYLPDFDIWIEVKKFDSERTGEQIKSQENVVLIQGKKAMEFFIGVLKEKFNHPTK